MRQVARTRSHGCRACKGMCLRDATVQDVQLELIRRSQFNAFDGARVAKDLLSHRKLWISVLMDHFGVPNPPWMPSASLMKLRDLDGNYWNVDTLYVLAKSATAARKLASFRDRWIADSAVVHDQEETERVLGGWGLPGRLVTFWWD